MTEEGFGLLDGEHAIVLVMFGDAVKATEVAGKMLEQDVFVTAFSFPVVPKGAARIRVQLSAEDIEACVQAFVASRQTHRITIARGSLITALAFESGHRNYEPRSARATTSDNTTSIGYPREQKSSDWHAPKEAKTMSAPVPTGLLRAVDQGFDLVMTRSLPIELAEAWAWLTESESTARWTGRWEGIGARGESIMLQMGFE